MSVIGRAAFAGSSQVADAAGQALVEDVAGQRVLVAGKGVVQVALAAAQRQGDAVDGERRVAQMLRHVLADAVLAAPRAECAAFPGRPAPSATAAPAG